jgi:hypothetical protein
LEQGVGWVEERVLRLVDLVLILGGTGRRVESWRARGLGLLVEGVQRGVKVGMVEVLSALGGGFWRIEVGDQEQSHYLLLVELLVE